MTRSLDTVAVYVDLERFDDPVLMGSLRRQTSRTGDIFSFEYEPTWLQKAEAFTFDPDLALVRGPQYPVSGRANFGIFLDSSPDRWGRVLMQRRENMRARLDGRRARSLTEWDFLLGVHDETRLGALRFKIRRLGDSSTATINLRRRRSPRCASFKRQVWNSNCMVMKQSTPTMNGGWRNYSLLEHHWAARGRRRR